MAEAVRGREEEVRAERDGAGADGLTGYDNLELYPSFVILESREG